MMYLNKYVEPIKKKTTGYVDTVEQSILLNILVSANMKWF